MHTWQYDLLFFLLGRFKVLINPHLAIPKQSNYVRFMKRTFLYENIIQKQLLKNLFQPINANTT